MKTLILNGSPRPDGDTVSLLRRFVAHMPGECMTVNACACGISHCLDCRFCRTHPGCAIQDGMQEVYGFIQECDSILIASPLWFSELTGPLLSVGSRLQTYFCARHFRGEEPILKPKRGAVLLVGGGDGHTGTAYETACTLLHHMNCRDIHPAVVSHNTNERPAIADEPAAQGVKDIAAFFNHCV